MSCMYERVISSRSRRAPSGQPGQLLAGPFELAAKDISNERQGQLAMRGTLTMWHLPVVIK